MLQNSKDCDIYQDILHDKARGVEKPANFIKTKNATITPSSSRPVENFRKVNRLDRRSLKAASAFSSKKFTGAVLLYFTKK